MHTQKMFGSSCEQMMMLQYQQRPMAMAMANMENNRWKPSVEIAPSCPRCASPNTKFCYYNNYSLSQPRYFCKGCRRYWTKGGSLRNVPVGGGCRKNRRSRPARSSLQAGNVGSGYVNNQSGSSSDSAGESSEQADIDMAEVFAKFLNQNSEQQNHDGDSSSGTSSESLGMPPPSFESQWENTATMDYNGPSGLTEEAQLQNVLPPQMLMGEQDDEIQELMAQNTNLLELQQILNDELPQDVPWGNDTPSFPNIAWQQDFESFPCSDDQLKIAADVVIDDWSSSPLDLPAGGNFF